MAFDAAFYDEMNFFSRLGNAFTCRTVSLRLPNDVTLDCELYGGQFHSTVSIVKTVNSVHWKNISFQVFDIPSRGTEPFEERCNSKRPSAKAGHTPLSRSASHTKSPRPPACPRQAQGGGARCEGSGGLGRRRSFFSSVAPWALSIDHDTYSNRVYEVRRSGSLLKIKTFYDAEAVVTGHVPDKGRNQGLTGALKQLGKVCPVSSSFLLSVECHFSPILFICL
ncbi:hypothetical protein GALMADRAFT_133813 [Galerina marginata CBS 339.88]|uniref:Uncharacterized protein n=1 Tax=Galerina marginata (strain CBS 339.88) TaxID=685588 RepID=A0A067TMV4_GALM3|nr:hypothetical protein GALMADRAFT_133813 [Galerina marginata CBS 339.88]